MSSWPECDDTSPLSKKEIWINLMQKTKVKKLWNEGADTRNLAKSLEEYDYFVALNNYRQMSAERRHAGDKDIALYANDKSIQVNQGV
jgi:hypothetical protein